LLAWLKHAFAVEPADAFRPSEEEAALVNRLARVVVRRGLTAPALIALECSRNLNFLASQVLMFFAPMVQLLFDSREYTVFTAFLERRGSIEYMCQRIEAIADELAAPARGSHASSPSGDAG